MRMRAQFRHVDKQDIVDMYIYIHACALNRKNVTKQRMQWVETEIHIRAYFSFKVQYILMNTHMECAIVIKNIKKNCLP